MSYTDKDILKILNIQARTLKRIDVMARDIVDEVASQRQFIARLYKEIKNGHEQEQQENTADCDSEELPSNVLQFPGEKI